MFNYNRVILVGHATAEPELSTGERQRAQFTLATNREWKNASGEKETAADFHRVIAWKGLASIVQKRIHKGTKVFIDGQLRHRSYETEDKQKKYVTEVVATDIIFMQEAEGSAD